MSSLDSIPTAEVWKPIPGFDGAFDASTHGRIRTNGRCAGTRCYPEKIMRPIPLASGYLKVNLSLEGRVRQRRIHQLILETFVGPCPEGMEVRHLDGDRTNNRLDNVRWGTQQQNTEDKYRHGSVLFGEANPRAKLTWDVVRGIRRDIAEGVSREVVKRKYGIAKGPLSRIVLNRIWREQPKCASLPSPSPSSSPH
jgi:hypothetical protein